MLPVIVLTVGGSAAGRGKGLYQLFTGSLFGTFLVGTVLAYGAALGAWLLFIGTPSCSSPGRARARPAAMVSWKCRCSSRHLLPGRQWPFNAALVRSSHAALWLRAWRDQCWASSMMLANRLRACSRSSGCGCAISHSA